MPRASTGARTRAAGDAASPRRWAYVAAVLIGSAVVLGVGLFFALRGQPVEHFAQPVNIPGAMNRSIEALIDAQIRNPDYPRGYIPCPSGTDKKECDRRKIGAGAAMVLQKFTSNSKTVGEMAMSNIQNIDIKNRVLARFAEKYNEVNIPKPTATRYGDMMTNRS